MVVMMVSGSWFAFGCPSPRLAATQGVVAVCCSSTHDDPGCQMARRMGTASHCSPCYHLNLKLPKRNKKNRWEIMVYGRFKPYKKIKRS